ncbi:DUF6386 family protein [Rheinheimera sp.]|uniref:DUF6386 family protein n=1 Tax=Rheinheimera sp. TaxID=1869214 RepID=UPI002732E100|nr:DUF6386 family protein [Rheinheimera sp.]MDP2713462.1 DUF6386 family protein [Rheinheimera sp.]
MDIFNFKFVTDTSTLCVFDLECLKHRLDDDVDWWSIPNEELSEVNNGNVAFFGLGGDGEFIVKLVDNIGNPKVRTNLKITSGKVFVGAGEEVTADELEPECVRGGAFIDLKAGSYVLSAKCENGVIELAFEPGTKEENDFKDVLRLVE